jgi:hypothetical protein
LRPLRRFMLMNDKDEVLPMFLRLWISTDRRYNAYLALFICFVTRALYLELVSVSTSSSFIAAFRRFTSRRELCRYLYSYNLTTFKEADIELRNMFKSVSTFYNKIGAILSNDGSFWTFIPPNTSYNAGQWEAGVKSAKYHLKRTFHMTCSHLNL